MQIYIYKEKGNATSTTSTKPPSVALINLSFSFLLLLVCGQRPAGNITQIQWSFTPQWCMGFKHHQRQLYNKYIDDNFSQRTMMRLQTHHTTQCSKKTPLFSTYNFFRHGMLSLLRSELHIIHKRRNGKASLDQFWLAHQGLQDLTIYH